VPIAFSQDGTKLAVLHPTGLAGGSMSGWLEIVAAPTLRTIASYTHVTVRISTSPAGSGYAPDAAFGPDGNWLIVSGTLVDLTRGKTTQAGDGGWLPNGVLITSSGGTVLIWQGSHSTPDSDFPAGGSIATSRHGDVVEFFGDGRPPLLLTAGGSLRQLDLPGVASLSDAQLAPNGGAIAVLGKSTDGKRVTAVAPLN
jgi:hypothetical protein